MQFFFIKILKTTSIYKFILLIGLLTSPFFIQAQSYISGVVKNAAEKRIEGVQVLANDTIETFTDENGAYRLKVKGGQKYKLHFSYIGYKTQVTDSVFIPINKNAEINIILGENMLPEVVITDNTSRAQPGIVKLELKELKTIASASDAVISMIKTLPGVVSNNELSLQYSVRGGNFDENLIFINDFEIYKPQLLHSSQQEGLNVPNPDLIQSLSFSTGGFQARYGDKMSSVLQINYKQPTTFKGSLSIGLLNNSLHLEGASKNRLFKYLIGARNRSSGYLLKSLETTGEYKPSANDIQSFFTYDLNTNLKLEALIYYSNNRFEFTPESRTTKFGVFNEVKAFDVYYDTESGEDDRYTVQMAGIGLTHTIHDSLTLKWNLSAYNTYEQERFNMIGVYTMSDVETDLGSDTYGETKSLTGYGFFQNWARNTMDANIFSLAHRGNWLKGNHSIEWGATVKHESILDKLSEWERLDSAGYINNSLWDGGYTIPHSLFDSMLIMSKTLKSKNEMTSTRFSAYLQDTWNFGKDQGTQYVLNLGVRALYWTLNQELSFNPRAQFSILPKSKDRSSWAFKVAAGLYDQAPFYRELRRRDGTLNREIRSQKSLQFVLGADRIFRLWGRDFKFTSEAYYKHLYDLIPYELDNVLIRYFGENKAVGYATGIDFRVNGEFIEDAESWFSVSFLQTKENIQNDDHYKYLLSNGQTSFYKPYTSAITIVDSTLQREGYLPRPTNQLINIGVYFQDYFPTWEFIRMNLTFNIGSGLPFGPADGYKWNDRFYTPVYWRADIGLSALLYDRDKKERRKVFPTRFFKKVWLTAECYNVMGNNNTISYVFVKDFSSREYGVPNRLTSRRLSARLSFDF